MLRALDLSAAMVKRTDANNRYDDGGYPHDESPHMTREHAASYLRDPAHKTHAMTDMCMLWASLGLLGRTIKPVRDLLRWLRRMPRAP